MKGQNGGIVSRVRSSKRIVVTADQDFVEKTTKMKARQNLECGNDKGKEHHSSFYFSR
jgi:hypothetical protein